MQGFGHYAKESRKQKRVKELHISQGKMMMCKQSEQVFHCKQRQADWLEDTDEEFDDEKLEAHYSFMAKIQEVLMKNPVLLISHWNSYCFVHELKKEMREDFEYVESLEKEIDELESEKADFSNIYDLLLEECVSKDVICSYLHSLSDLMLILEYNAYILHNVKESYLNSCTGMVESEHTHGSNVDIPHILMHAKQTHGFKCRVWLLKMLISKKPVPECDFTNEELHQDGVC
ncbi:hypothetical protein Tco_0661989 [Tanacetum coccineum]